jgi:ketosteroid isomerase-like protein
MSTHSTAPITLVLGMLLSACQPQGSDSEAATDAEYEAPDFAAMNEAYGAAMSSGDAEALGMLYAEEAVSMPPNEPSLVGKASIVADAAEGFAAMSSSLTSQSEGSYLMGDVAVEWGTYSFSGTMVDSDVTVSQDGKYVAIYERQADGSWKIVRDIWNANAATEMAMDEEDE